MKCRGQEVLCPGPGHSDKDRSLSVKLKGDGKGIVVHSFSGDDIIAAQGYRPGETRLAGIHAKQENERQGQAAQGDRREI